jgi:regulator of protease activity HflC (stomatin/prohibitin superfamily)
MRDILIGLIVVISFLITSIFCVEPNFVVIKTNIVTNNLDSYGVGVHFRLPFITNLSYINLSKRADVIDTTVTNESGIKLQHEYMVIWHVVDPIIYYQKFIKNKQQTLFDYVTSLQNNKNPNKFLENKGIIIDKIILVNQMSILMSSD